MTTFFVDTSAAAKQYINEQGSGWVRNNLDPSTGNVVIVSELLKPEIEGTLSRYHLGRYILTRAHVMLRNEFLRHFEREYLVVTVGASLLDYAAQLIRKHFLVGAYRLRTLDAIHLACALEARAALNEPVVFVVADERLRNAALAEGFYVENPEAYPSIPHLIALHGGAVRHGHGHAGAHQAGARPEQHPVPGQAGVERVGISFNQIR